MNKINNFFSKGFWSLYIICLVISIIIIIKCNTEADLITWLLLPIFNFISTTIIILIHIIVGIVLNDTR
jgi:hypothetical protein